MCVTGRVWEVQSQGRHKPHHKAGRWPRSFWHTGSRLAPSTHSPPSHRVSSRESCGPVRLPWRGAQHASSTAGEGLRVRGNP